jgi:hypothetical protein
MEHLQYFFYLLVVPREKNNIFNIPLLNFKIRIYQFRCFAKKAQEEEHSTTVKFPECFLHFYKGWSLKKI